MTQRSFDILDYCTTWLQLYNFGIFQDRWIKTVVSDVPSVEDDLYKGMWLFVTARNDVVFRATGEEADNIIKCSMNNYLYLYRLE